MLSYVLMTSWYQLVDLYQLYNAIIEKDEFANAYLVYNKFEDTTSKEENLEKKEGFLRIFAMSYD